MCPACRPPGSAAPAPETFELLARAARRRLGGRPTPPTPQHRREGSGLVAAFLQWHLERGLRSLPHGGAVSAPSPLRRRPSRTPAAPGRPAIPPTWCRATSPSSWTATAAGPTQRGLPRTKGHEAGEASLLDVVAGAIEVGVTHLSAYAFSTENWKRSPDEVRFLMGFNRDVIRRRRDQLHEWGVRMRWVGRRPRLWGSVIKELEVAQELTRHNTGLTLYFCVNYGGRAEIADAVQRLAEDVARGPAQAAPVDERTIARYLDEPDMPDVDLFVRSSGEQRTSNFLLWQSAYAEMVFQDQLWPDFDRRDLWAADPVLRRPRAALRRCRRRSERPGAPRAA